MSTWINSFKRAPAYIILRAALLPFAVCLILVAIAWKPDFPSARDFWWGEGGVGVLILVLSSIVGGGIGTSSLDPGRPDPKNTESTPHYNRHLIGVGYALFVFGVSSCVLVCGLIVSGRMPLSADSPQPESSKGLGFLAPEGLATLIVLSCVVAVLGALFFVANSLREKREAGLELFSSQRFWGGLWYRLGEAILFSLVAFWLIWSNVGTTADSAISYSWLPLLSLLMGMFVTSGEKLIFGIARGLFRAAGAFFTPQADEDTPSDTKPTSKPSDPDVPPKKTGNDNA